MNSVELNHMEESADYIGECGEETSPETDGIDGDPSVLPRLGDQYQAEIPSLLSESELQQLRRSPINSHAELDGGFSFGLGLAIPIIWVKHERDEFLGNQNGADTAVSVDSINNREETGGYTPLPGSPVVSWSDFEVRSFLLGLYIFGKNLVQVREFMGNKEMGDMLSFYYGKFYKSDAHQRWSESRKIRGRRCIHGQRIFTGWRQQEMLSRLLPSLPVEVQANLLGVTKSFSEGRSSLEEFVFALKPMVGLELLVEAVGIGKGKHDLTGTVLDPVRSNQPFPLRPEIPVGKACSALTSGDIIKFLTGGFRLSKAKSNDLFWEAVWPRLLARGWHSEQPRDANIGGSKNSLVFLVPGINKFSRKKLTKGNHYFDSVSDVLHQVALDPRLLELDLDDQNDPSDQQRHCYLRPRLLNSPSEVKFTVVDTSLFQGEGPSKVRELQSLPVDAVLSYKASTSSEDTNGDDSEDTAESDVSTNGRGKSGSVVTEYDKVSITKKCIIGKGMQPEPPDHMNSKKPEKDTKCQYRRRLKSREPEDFAPESKKQRLTGCKYAGECHPSSSSRVKIEDEECKEELMETNQIIGGEVGPSERKSDSKVNWFDLNIPQFSPDFDTGEPFCMEIADGQDRFDPKETSFHSETKPQLDGASNGESSIQEQPTNNGRRQSTRNRPPTARALEALACGFLSTKRKGRGTKTIRSDDLAPRPSRRARRTAGAPVPSPTSNPGLASAIPSPPMVVSDMGMKEEYGSTTSHASVVDNSRAWPESKDHGFLGVLYCSEFLD